MESAGIIFDVSSDAEALSHKVAKWLLDLARAKNGTFAVALSGGTTPKRLYERLAAAPYLEVFPWARVHWFWGDERFVPADDPQSNYRMVRETLLAKAPIPTTNVHPVICEGINLAGVQMIMAMREQLDEIQRRAEDLERRLTAILDGSTSAEIVPLRSVISFHWEER